MSVERSRAKEIIVLHTQEVGIPKHSDVDNSNERRGNGAQRFKICKHGRDMKGTIGGTCSRKPNGGTCNSNDVWGGKNRTRRESA